MYSVPSAPQNPNNWVPHATTTSPTATPTSPTRPGRLRGLSYLRNYTQNHLLSRDHGSSSTGNSRPSGPMRATSYPSPTSSRGSIVHAAPTPSTNDSVNGRSSNPEDLASTGGSSAVDVASRATSNPQTSTTDSSSPAINSSTTASTQPARAMARTRSATVGDAAEMPSANIQPRAEGETTANGEGSRVMAHQLPSIRFSSHQDPRAQRPSLVFSPMARILPTGKEIIKVGRYSERDSQPQQAANVPSSAPVGFKSKVVSRRHCEFWCAGGKWFIKDVKSSSGTFLNHIRLSSPGTESRPFPINDGDIVQLGIDFKGGEEMIFRCVKIRVELNKGWQQGPTSFNVQSHKRLRELNNIGAPVAGGSSQDCSICLGPIAPCQSLFVAPCSHTWHYKCIRVIINGPHWPHFVCPNCRTVADLEAELDDPYAMQGWEKLPVEENEAAIPPSMTTNPGGQEQQSNSETGSGEAMILTPPPDQVDEQANTTRSQPISTLSETEAIETTETAVESGARNNYQEQVSESDFAALSMRDTNSPSPSSSSQSEQVSSSTVQPVDIIPRKPLAPSSHLTQSQSDNRGTRTPSPNGIARSLSDQITSGEGPMTPRNDVGPFIFDGSGGRIANLASAQEGTNLSAASRTPQNETQDG